MVNSVAVQQLCQVVVRAGVCLVVVPRVGDFGATGMPLVVVHGGGDVDDHEIRRAVALAKERDNYVALAVDEIRHWGADSTQIHRRISSMLDDLGNYVTPDRKAVLVECRQLLAARRDDLPAPERHVVETLP